MLNLKNAVMKKIKLTQILISFILIININNLSAQTFNSPHDVINNLTGNWKWTSKCGGIVFNCEYPLSMRDNSGIAFLKVNSFTDSVDYIKFEKCIIANKGRAIVKLSNTIFGQKWVIDGINGFATNTLVINIENNNTLELSENCNDCFGYTYIKEDIDIPDNNPFIESNKTWNVLSGGYGSRMVECNLTTDTYNINTDSIYASGIALWHTDNILNPNKKIGYLSENNKKVTFTDFNNNSIILYDFNLKVNDTVKSYYYIDIYDNYTVKKRNFELKYIVKKIDTLSYNNTPRLKYSLLIINELSFEIYSLANDEWIEGIGSIYGLLNSPIFHEEIRVGGFTELLCVSVNNNNIYKNSSRNYCYLNSINNEKYRLSNSKISYSNEVKLISELSLPATCIIPCIDSFKISIQKNIINVTTFRPNIVIGEFTCQMAAFCSDTINLGYFNLGEYKIEITDSKTDTNGNVIYSTTHFQTFNVGFNSSIINSIKIIPTKPTTNDSISIICETYNTPETINYNGGNDFWIDRNKVYARTFFDGCTSNKKSYTDTIKIGKLKAGLYNLEYMMFDFSKLCDLPDTIMNFEVKQYTDTLSYITSPCLLNNQQYFLPELPIIELSDDYNDGVGFLTYNKGLVFTNAKQFNNYKDSVRNEINYLNIDTATIPYIDFSKYSLIGYPVNGQCEFEKTIKVYKDSVNNQYIYDLTIQSVGDCKKLVSSHNWVLVPALPINYKVYFDIFNKDLDYLSRNNINEFNNQINFNLTPDSVKINGTILSNCCGTHLVTVNNLNDTVFISTIDIGMLCKCLCPYTFTINIPIIKNNKVVNFKASEVDTIYNIGTTIIANQNLNAISSVEIYPNPSNSIINLKISNNAILNKVHIIDIMGRIVSIEQNTNLQFNVSNLQQGFYFVNVQLNNNQTYNVKFLKK